VVVFAPGGVTGLLMMHRPLLKAGNLTRVLPSYLVALVPTLAMIAGLILSIETIVHYTVNPGDDSHIKAFGVSFDAASPYIWAMAAIFLIGGFLVARITWSRVGHAWDEATSAARERGMAA
jgi:branched-chain amino acid transport system permease protein